MMFILYILGGFNYLQITRKDMGYNPEFDKLESMLILACWPISTIIDIVDHILEDKK